MLVGRKFGEKPSFPIPVWNGLLEHRPRIGGALWEFLWCLDRITSEKDGVGIVLGGSPVKAARIAANLDAHPSVVKANLKRLESQGYIHRRRTPYGLVLTVLNSCKFDVWKAVRRSRESRSLVVGEVGNPAQRSRESRPEKSGIPPSKEDTAVDREKPSARSKRSRAPQPDGDRVKRFQDFAHRTWEEAHAGRKPTWGPKDFTLLAQVVRAHPELSDPELEQVWRNFLASTEPFIGDRGHQPADFRSHFDRLITGPITGRKGGKLSGDALTRANLAAAGYAVR